MFICVCWIVFVFPQVSFYSDLLYLSVKFFFSQSCFPHSFLCFYQWLVRWLSGKESTCNAGDGGLIPVWGRIPGGGHGNPLQSSCLENPLDRGAWRATVHKSQRVRQDWSAWAHTHTVSFMLAFLWLSLMVHFSFSLFSRTSSFLISVLFCHTFSKFCLCFKLLVFF